MILRLALFGFSALFLAAGCGGGEAPSANEAPAPEAPLIDHGARLDAALSGAHRDDKDRARDSFRNPKATLEFFGVESDMAVLEAWPGGGWYTKIIGNYLQAGGGKLYAAHFPQDTDNDYLNDALAAFRETYLDSPDLYGEIELTTLAPDQAAPEASIDVALSFRNVHNWQGQGNADAMFTEFFRVLKPGGVLGIVAHRADGAELPRDGSSGYSYTEDVRALAEAAGFLFEAASEANANPKDTKVHPFGVWTLPPVRRSSEVRGVENADFDGAAYEAIGESDRMTLKFRKPVSPDNALLE